MPLQETSSNGDELSKKHRKALKKSKAKLNTLNHLRFKLLLFKAKRTETGHSCPLFFLPRPVQDGIGQLHPRVTWEWVL